MGEGYEYRECTTKQLHNGFGSSSNVRICAVVVELVHVLPTRGLLMSNIVVVLKLMGTALLEQRMLFGCMHKARVVVGAGAAAGHQQGYGHTHWTAVDDA